MACVQLSFPNGELLHFANGIVQGYNGPLLAGASVMSVEQDFGSLMVQELVTEEYSLRYTFYDFLKKIRIKGKAEGDALFSRVMLRNNLCHQIAGAGKVHLREGEFCLLKSIGFSGEIIYSSKKYYETFDSRFSRRMLEQLEPAFPSVRLLISGKEQRKSFVVSKNHKRANKAIHEIIKGFLNCPYTDDMLRFYFDTKVREYLFLLLDVTYEKQKERSLTRKQLDAIHLAKEIITGDIKRHFLISEIAQMVQLNERDLKRGYKEVFGVGLFETHLSELLEIARKLVIETDMPFKEISGIAGYKYTSNFSNAFKRHFGETPLSCRRNR